MKNSEKESEMKNMLLSFPLWRKGMALASICEFSFLLGPPSYLAAGLLAWGKSGNTL